MRPDITQITIDILHGYLTHIGQSFVLASVATAITLFTCYVAVKSQLI